MISIHALREEGDAFNNSIFTNNLKFLSTPSARRATHKRPDRREPHGDFYPRPPRGGRQPSQVGGTEVILFLSTPSARRATPSARKRATPKKFLSTPSARRATSGRIAEHHAPGNFYPRPPRGGRPSNFRYACPFLLISIHALREEGDRNHGDDAAALRDFYPRPPRGGRPGSRYVCMRYLNFYPRPPRGGRQQKQRQNLYFQTNYTTFCTDLEEL